MKCAHCNGTGSYSGERGDGNYCRNCGGFGRVESQRIDDILEELVAKAIYGDGREIPWAELPLDLKATWRRFASRAIDAMDGKKAETTSLHPSILPH